MSAFSTRPLEHSLSWKWRQFSWRRHLHWVALISLGLAVVSLFMLALVYQKIQDRLVLFSSPLSPLQQDHPSLKISHYDDITQLGTNGAFMDAASTSRKVQNEEHLNSSRFFRSATAAAAKLGTVLSWNQDTIRLLRGSKVEEIFFLFYDSDIASQSSSLSQNPSEKISSSAPEDEMSQGVLSIFKRVAAEDRNEQQTLLPYVAVPKQNMHTLSFFLPDSVAAALPAALIVRTDSGWIKYHAPHAALRSVPQMKDFLYAYRQGKVQPTLRSEDPIIDDDDTPIKPLVAANFVTRVVESTDSDSLVFLYATWCGHCRRFEKNLLELASTFRGIGSIKFLKMDVSRNDVPIMGLRVERVPHVLYFVRDPDASQNQALNVKEPKSEFAPFTSLRLGAEQVTYTGTGKARKRVLVFDHSNTDVPSYGKAFLLQHAYCKKIDLSLHTDCNTGKDTAEL